MTVSPFKSVTVIFSYLSGTDIYGEKILTASDPQNREGGGHYETQTVLRLALRDSLREYGPINDMVFGLARNGVSNYVSARVRYADILLRIAMFPNW